MSNAQCVDRWYTSKQSQNEVNIQKTSLLIPKENEASKKQSSIV